MLFSISVQTFNLKLLCIISPTGRKPCEKLGLVYFSYFLYSLYFTSLLFVVVVTQMVLEQGNVNTQDRNCQ